MILNRARTTENFSPPAEVVARLSRPGALQRAQTALTALQMKHDAVRAALRAAIVAAHLAGSDTRGQIERQIQELDAELRRLDEASAAARETRDQAMRPF